MGRSVAGSPIVKRYIGTQEVVRRYIGASLVYGVVEAGTPSAPGLTVTALTQTSATLTWTAPTSPGTSAVTGYLIGWNELGGQQRTWSAPYRVDVLSEVVVNLAPDVDYDFWVEATNESGPGARTTVRARTAAAAAATPSALPARVVQGYFPSYFSLRLRDTHPNYNLIMWAFAVGVGTSDPGAVKMNFVNSTNNHANTITDVAALKAAGKKVILSIGGWFDLGSTFGYLLTTTAHVDRFMATVVPLIDTYGFNGIDWDLERAGNFTGSAMIDASQRLKALFGPSFIIGAAPYGGANPPNGENTGITNPYRDLALGLGTDLDLMSFQFYNNGTNTLANVKAWASTYITRCGLADSQWAFGWTTRDPSSAAQGAVTPAFCTEVWDSWLADGREARGSMLWSIGHDQQDSPAYRWALEHGGHVLATPTTDATPPVAPGAATLASPATAISGSGFTSTWTVGANTTDVLVRRRLAGGTFTTVATVPASTLTYAHISLDSSTAYEVQVIPRNGTTQGTASNTVATTTGAPDPALYVQDWDGTNGSGIASWRARSAGGATRATSLVLDTTVDAGGGTTAGSLKWSLNASGASAVELAGTVAVTPSSTVTMAATMRNGDSVAQQLQLAFDQFTSAGAYVTTVFGTAVTTASGASTALTVTATVGATVALIRPAAAANGGALSASFHVDRVRVTA